MEKDLKDEIVSTLQKRVDLLERRELVLMDALRANGIFHTPLAMRKLCGSGSWDEYQLDAIQRTREAVGP